MLFVSASRPQIKALPHALRPSAAPVLIKRPFTGNRQASLSVAVSAGYNMLTAKQKEQFEADGTLRWGHFSSLGNSKLSPVSPYTETVGYLVLENFTPVAQLAEMRRQAVALVADFDPETISVFSTKNQVSPLWIPAHVTSPGYLSCT